MKPSTLYKIHENPDCDILQSIVRYMYVMKLGDARPICIVERNMPTNITILPTIIMKNGNKIEGIDNISNYYEKLTNTTDLIKKACQFNKLNPNYRIGDNSTHKKIIYSVEKEI